MVCEIGDVAAWRAMELRVAAGPGQVRIPHQRDTAGPGLSLPSARLFTESVPGIPATRGTVPPLTVAEVVGKDTAQDVYGDWRRYVRSR